MVSCECASPHVPRRVVLTGGPGAGKTAVLELIRQAFCRHVVVLQESAGILFGGGFPRGDSAEPRRAAQRAIYFVQRELEAVATGWHPAVILCDRGTVDGSAYWPGPDDFFTNVGSSLTAELGHYDAVIHLCTPDDSSYNHDNPLRLETPAQARAIDDRIKRAWAQHPRRTVIEADEDFLAKAARAIEALRRELPACCRTHVVPSIESHLASTRPVIT